jgi:hypothetical protein
MRVLKPRWWRWQWSRLRVPLGIAALFLLLLATGFVLAGNIQDASGTQGASSVYETTVLQSVTTKVKGRTVVKVVPRVRTVRVVSAETVLETRTQGFRRTITQAGAEKVVTDSITTEVPVVKQVVVTSPPRTSTRTVSRTERSTVTNESTVTQSRTEVRTDTRTQTVVKPITQTLTNTITDVVPTTVRETNTITVTDVVPTTVTVTETKKGPP